MNTIDEPGVEGSSGPTTVRSIVSRSARSAEASGSSALIGKMRATDAIPGLPGAHMFVVTRSRESFQASACSRPPPPTTSTFIRL